MASNVHAALPSLAASEPVAQKLTSSAPVSSNTESMSKPQEQSTDRFENYNRNAFRLNDKIDKAVLHPAAIGYVTYVPLPLRLALSNFFNNLRDFVTLGNDILQLNGQSSMKNVMRISINTTFGLGGILDVSSALGLVQNKNSFGNTMRVYGWTNSSYYVIPLLGPSTVRDAIGLIPDTIFNPIWTVVNDNYISIGLFALNAVNTRSQFLGFDKILETSIDPYITMRDTYLATIHESIPTSNSAESSPSIDSLLEDDASTSQK
ncbi:MAG: transporter [Burkholderiales bacterium]|jgi:phospholipid-binding lipoprotein MlaA|nr:transporter [Burkholderiales bacterium]MCE3268157.1 transporter [Burkholderiales bacterium]